MSKKTLAILVAELVGTFVLTAVVLSVNRYGLPIFTALAAGVALATMVVAVGPLTGGHFNPAVTLGMFSMRKIELTKAVGYVAAQAVGAVLAWKLYEWFVDKPVRLSVTEFDWKVFVAELLGAMLFGLAIAAALSRKLDSYSQAVVIGSGLFLGATLASLVAAAGAINPAVSIALGYRPENAGYLAYLLGPVIGAVVGMNFYQLAFDDKPILARASSATTVKKVVAARPAKRKPAARKRTTTRSRR